MPRSPGGPGRPKAPLRPPRSVLTRQVRRLVDEAHLGNLSEAATHAGVSYGTLRDLYIGRSSSPGLPTLRQLATAYGLSTEWFTEGGAETPLAAVQGILPPDPEAPRGRPRRITIPFAAWPLVRVFLLLEPYLRALPPGPSRPILGGAADDETCRQRLTTYLLGPLLEAQALGQLTLLGADPPFRGADRPTPECWRVWVQRLRALGSFWALALEELLTKAESLAGQKRRRMPRPATG